ncbi:MAG: putative Ig domain-containing protein [Myxococcota bacterium]
MVRWWSGVTFLVFVFASAGGAEAQFYRAEVGTSTRCTGVIDIRNTGQQLLLVDAPSFVPGMPFSFFGAPVSGDARLYPKVNGVLDLIWPMGGYYGNATDPGTGTGLMAGSGYLSVARFFDSGGIGRTKVNRVTWEVRGSAPARTLVVLWDFGDRDVLGQPVPELYAEVLIDESSGVIEIAYSAARSVAETGWIGLKSAYAGAEHGLALDGSAFGQVGCLRYVPTATATPPDPYAVESKASTFADLTATGTRAAIVTDVGVPGQPGFRGHTTLAVPFTLSALGTTVTSSAALRVDTDGTLWFGAAPIAALRAADLSAAEIRWATVGTPGARTWTIAWSGVRYDDTHVLSSDYRADLEVRFHEATNQVELIADHLAAPRAFPLWYQAFGADVAFGTFHMCSDSWYSMGQPQCGVAPSDSLAAYGTLLFTPRAAASTALRLVRTSTLPTVVGLAAAVPLEIDVESLGGTVLGAEVVVELASGQRLTSALVPELQAGQRLALPITATIPADVAGPISLRALLDPAHRLPEGDRSDDVLLLGDTFVGTPPPLEVDALPLPGTTVGAVYSQTLGVRGGVAPLQIDLAPLPAGLSFDAARGALTGSPSAAGSFALVLSAEDRLGQRASQTLTLVVARPPRVVSSALPEAQVGAAYAAPIETADGTAPITLTATPLPPGLSFDPATRQIRGTPIAAGTTQVVVQAIDAAGVAGSQTLALLVHAAASTPPPPGDSGGCGCGASGAPDAGMLLALGVLLRRRRRCAALRCR